MTRGAVYFLLCAPTQTMRCPFREVGSAPVRGTFGTCHSCSQVQPERMCLAQDPDTTRTRTSFLPAPAAVRNHQTFSASIDSYETENTLRQHLNALELKLNRRKQLLKSILPIRSEEITVLEYAGNGLWSRREDLYNPNEATEVLKCWLAAGGHLQAASKG